MSLYEADITESGKVFHTTTHDGIYDDKNLAVDEMENSTVFVRKLYAVLLLTDWGIFSRNPGGPSPCKSLGPPASTPPGGYRSLDFTATAAPWP